MISFFLLLIINFFLTGICLTSPLEHVPPWSPSVCRVGRVLTVKSALPLSFCFKLSNTEKFWAPPPGADTEVERGQLSSEESCREAAVSMGGRARMEDSREGFGSCLVRRRGGTATSSPLSRLEGRLSSLMGSGLEGSSAWMEESGRLGRLGLSAGEAGREVRLARLSLSSPESDSLSIRSEAPQPSSSQARPDLSESDRSERKGL